MKKIISVLILCFFFATNVFGVSPIPGEWPRRSRGLGRGFPQGLLFMTTYDGNVNADFAKASPTATFAASRGASNPATYFDASGVMQKTETSNVARYNYGYYDTGGYTAFSQAGAMIEGASTNYLTYGIFSAGATLSTGWTDDSNTDSAPTYSRVAETVTNITDSKAQKMVYTGVAADVDVFAQFSQNTAAASFAQSDNVTVSCWIKGSSSGVTIKLGYNEYNNVPAVLSSNNGSDIASSISATEWRRFTYSHAADEATCDRISVKVLVDGIDDGDTVDIQIACIQAEKLPYASSFIPTTAAALTRNAETLKYVNSGNRSAAVESCVVKIAPEFADSVIATEAHIHEADTKRNSLLFNDASNDVLVNPNRSDSSGSLVFDLINAAWTANTEMTLGSNAQHSSPYVAGFYQGVADGTNETADDFINPAWGTYFWVGSRNTGAEQLYGTIFAIAFFDRVLTAAEQKYLHDTDWRTLNPKGRYSGPK